MPLPVSTRRAGVMGSAPGPAMALTADDLPTQPKYHGKVCCCLTAIWRAVYSRGFPSYVEGLALYEYLSQLAAQAVLRLVTKLVVQEPKGWCSWYKLTCIFIARLYFQTLVTPGCLAELAFALGLALMLASSPCVGKSPQCVTAHC